MRRARREHAGGEVAMMAVITKAMGAFLVLMILLLPYYKGDLKGHQTSGVAQQAIAKAEAKIAEIKQQAAAGPVSAADFNVIENGLQAALAALSAAKDAVTKLAERLDQASSQINRLEQRVAKLERQTEDLQALVDRLKAEKQTLAQDNEKLEETLDKSFHFIFTSECDRGLVPVFLPDDHELATPQDIKAEFDRLQKYDQNDLEKTPNRELGPDRMAYFDRYRYSRSDVQRAGVPASVGVVLNDSGRRHVEELEKRYRELDRKRVAVAPAPPPPPQAKGEDLMKAQLALANADTKIREAIKVNAPIDSEMAKLLDDLPHCRIDVTIDDIDRMLFVGRYRLGPDYPLSHLGTARFYEDDFTKDKEPAIAVPKSANTLVAAEVCARQHWLCNRAKSIEKAKTAFQVIGK